MTFAKDDLIAALRLRYDYYSASNVFDIARERASIADKPAFEPADVRAIREVLPQCGDRLTAVLERFDELLGAAPAGKDGGGKKEEKKPEPPKAEAKAEEKKPEPAKAEAKAEEKKADKKAEAKPDDKKADAIETTIVLTGVTAEEGDQVLVCGDGELGDWDPENARPMKREGDQWLTTVKAQPETELSFKFLRRTADGTVIWEDGDNRSVAAKPRLEVTWR